jgi:hypothetical protein
MNQVSLEHFKHIEQLWLKTAPMDSEARLTFFLLLARDLDGPLVAQASRSAGQLPALLQLARDEVEHEERLQKADCSQGSQPVTTSKVRTLIPVHCALCTPALSLSFALISDLKPSRL